MSSAVGLTAADDASALEDALLSQPAEAVDIEQDNDDYEDDAEIMELSEEDEDAAGAGVGSRRKARDDPMLGPHGKGAHDGGAAGRKRPRAGTAASGTPGKSSKSGAGTSARRGGASAVSVKDARAAEVSKQMCTLRADQARAQKSRLRFLLGQSDLFRHFLEEGGAAQDSSDVAALLASPKRGRGAGAGAGSDRRHGAGGAKGKGRGKAGAGGGDDDDEDEEGGAGGELGMKAGTRLFCQPACITGGTLRDYQLEGLNWMISLHENGLSGILADEMGLGKTFQSIALIAWCWESLGDEGPHCVLVPKSTLSNWDREFRRFVPGLKTLILQSDSGKEQRHETIKTRLMPGMTAAERGWNVLLTTYETAVIEEGPLGKIPWRYCIIDEAHRIKNENSRLAATVRSFTSAHRLLITGTPLQNNLHELWALLNFLLPDVFGSSAAFDSWFNLASTSADEEAKAAVVKQLHRVLRPFMLRRLKSEVAKTLPPKTETMLYCGFTRMQRELYRGLLMRNIDTVLSGQKGGGDKTRLANLVMHLRKACCHPYLFEGVEDRTLPPLGDHLVANCAKLRLLDKLLPRLKERGSRCLIFSQFKTVLDILEDYCHMRSYQYCRIDGSTSYDEREEGIDTFNAPGSSKFLFLLSTRAGGLGINLATADIVILYDSDWNPQMDLQAMDRAHRIGQTKPVKVYRLVTSGSVEEKIIERAWVKLKLDAVVVQGGRLADKSKGLTKEDMVEMVQFGATAVFGKGDGGSGLGAGDDEDSGAIDAILAEGESRTKALTAAVELKVGPTKGMLDFSMHGGTSTQVFEGVDYRTADARKKLLEDGALALKLQVAEAMAEQSAIDRAARKAAVLSYNEGKIFKALQDMERSGGEGSSKAEAAKLRALLPVEHRPPKRMDPWQLYNKERIMAITAQEIAWLQARQGSRVGVGVGEGDASASGGVDPSAPFPVDLLAERSELVGAGYPDWRRSDFDAYCLAVKTYGRGDAQSIARALAPRGKGAREVTAYHTDLWERGRGAECLSESAYGALLKGVEKGEAAVREVQAQEKALAIRVARTDKGGGPRALPSDPWRALPLPSTGRIQGLASSVMGANSRLWTGDADRYLLAAIARVGFGRPDLVRSALLHEPLFRADHWLRARSSGEIEARCRALLRAVDRDLPEQRAREEKASAERAAAAAEAARKRAAGQASARAATERFVAMVLGDAENCLARDAGLAARKKAFEEKKAAEREERSAVAREEKASAERAAVQASARAEAPTAPTTARTPTSVTPALLPALTSFITTATARTAEDVAGAFLKACPPQTSGSAGGDVAMLDGVGKGVDVDMAGHTPRLPSRVQLGYLVDALSTRSKTSGPSLTSSGPSFTYRWTLTHSAGRWVGMSREEACAEYRRVGPILVELPVKKEKEGGKAGGGGSAPSAPFAPAQASKARKAEEDEETVDLISVAGSPPTKPQKLGGAEGAKAVASAPARAKAGATMPKPTASPKATKQSKAASVGVGVGLSALSGGAMPKLPSPSVSKGSAMAAASASGPFAVTVGGAVPLPLSLPRVSPPKLPVAVDAPASSSNLK